MGRWGMRLFEGDQDIDIAVEIDATLSESEGTTFTLRRMIHQSDIVAPPEAKAHYKTDEYLKKELPAIVAKCRATLDAGVGDKLFKMFRAKEGGGGDEDHLAKYRVIIVGAIMLRAGAKIRDDDLQHLRDLIPQIQSLPGLAPSLRDNPARPSAAALLVASKNIDDEGFRHPGRAQFLATLDSYKAGVPRSFLEPSCYKCGKIASDIGEALNQCARCKRAWYCNKDCQRAHWGDHKPTCIPPSKCFTVNV